MDTTAAYLGLHLPFQQHQPVAGNLPVSSTSAYHPIKQFIPRQCCTLTLMLMLMLMLKPVATQQNSGWKLLGLNK